MRTRGARNKKISERQLRFVDAYMGEAHGVAVKAMEIASGKRVSRETASKMLHHPAVVAEIEARQDLRKRISYLTEDAVLQGLYNEATSYEKGSNSASRTSAWVWIGKHLGMWKEKKEIEEKNITYNIVNYSSSEPKKEEKVIEEPTKKLIDIEIKEY